MRRLAFTFALLWLALPAQATQVFLTSGTTYTIPADAGIGLTSVECVGSGGNGSAGVANTSSGSGGGCGAYAKISNTVLPIGAVLTVQVSTGGGAIATFFKDNFSTTILSCDFGGNAVG